MTIPRQSEFEIPILEEVARADGALSPQEVYAAMARRFPEITKEEWEQKTRTGARKVWNIIQWARQKLVKNGEVDKSTPGVWRIMEKGLARISFTPVPRPLFPPPALPRRTTVAGKSRHEDLVDKIKAVREALGYSQGNLHGATYNHDSTFSKGELRTPFLVWEVCDGGNLDKDIASLQWAVFNWDTTGILVVTDSKDMGRAQTRLTTPKVRVIKDDFVDKLHEIITTIPGGADVIRTLLQ